MDLDIKSEYEASKMVKLIMNRCVLNLPVTSRLGIRERFTQSGSDNGTDITVIRQCAIFYLRHSGFYVRFLLQEQDPLFGLRTFHPDKYPVQ